MSMDISLRILTVALPLVGAMVVWLIGETHPHHQRRVTFFGLALAGLLVLLLFLTRRYHTCLLVPGYGNCVYEGLATLLLCGGSFGLILRLWSSDGIKDQGRSVSYISALLFVGTAATILFDNVLLWIIAWYIFSYVFYRSLRRQGLHWGFFIGHDDYRDDAITKRH